MTGEVVTIPLDKLRYGPKVRSESVDIEHVERLRAVLDACPPIVVRSGCMEILDGNHRRVAAQREGRSGIRAVLVSVGEAEAWEIAVKANTTHGKPLSALERRQAAEHLLAKTDWSDRRIAGTCGMAHSTVTSLRSTGQIGQLNKRESSDGKRRPASRTAARKQRENAAEAFRKDPTQSSRELAAEAGISTGTAASVIQAVKDGSDPVPPRLQPVPDAPQEVTVGELLIVIPTPWKNHPACQRSTTARKFGLFMDRRGHVAWDDVAGFIDHVPVELLSAALVVADECADTWARFAAELRNRDISLEDAG